MTSRGVQSVIFEARRWGEDPARHWLALHGFKATGKIHSTRFYHRFRQYDPRPYERYVTKALPNHPGVKLVVVVHGPPRVRHAAGAYRR